MTHRDEQGRILVSRWTAVKGGAYAAGAALICGMWWGALIAGGPPSVNCQYEVNAPTCTFVSLDEEGTQTGYFYNGREWHAVANGVDLGPSIDCGGTHVEMLTVKAPKYEARTLDNRKCDALWDCDYASAGAMSWKLDDNFKPKYDEACICLAVYDEAAK